MTPSGFDQAEYFEPGLAPPPHNPGLLGRAIAFGIAGAIAGAVIYAAFIVITHIQIGYLAIGVAYLIAKAMEVGSSGRGGRPYQWSAVVLTLISVAMGNSLMVWWGLRGQGIPLSLHNVLALLRIGFEYPFLEFRSSPAGAAIGLFILFIGLRAAWRMTSGAPGAVRHPFAR